VGSCETSSTAAGEASWTIYEAQSVMLWKLGHPSWQRLRALTAPTDG